MLAQQHHLECAAIVPPTACRTRDETVLEVLGRFAHHRCKARSPLLVAHLAIAKDRKKLTFSFTLREEISFLFTQMSSSAYSATINNIPRVLRFERGDGRYKYTAVLKDGTRVHFGHRDYQHYRDSVPVRMGGGLWRHKDHKDKKRRDGYRSRHAGVLTKSGRPAYQVKYSPAWFSWHYLW